MVKMRGWNNVGDDFPRETGKYIVTIMDEGDFSVRSQIASYKQGETKFRYHPYKGEVIAWMALPRPIQVSPFFMFTKKHYIEEERYQNETRGYNVICNGHTGPNRIGFYTPMNQIVENIDALSDEDWKHLKKCGEKTKAFLKRISHDWHAEHPEEVTDICGR